MKIETKYDIGDEVLTYDKRRNVINPSKIIGFAMGQNDKETEIEMLYRAVVWYSEAISGDHGDAVDEGYLYSEKEIFTDEESAQAYLAEKTPEWEAAKAERDAMRKSLMEKYAPEQNEEAANDEEPKKEEPKEEETPTEHIKLDETF